MKKTRWSLLIPVIGLCLSAPFSYATGNGEQYPHVGNGKEAVGSALQQSVIPVTGVVKDTHGDPLTGVNVVVKGTLTGTMTDIDGRFAINLPSATSALVFSYVGFEQMEVKYTGNAIFQVVMEESSLMLEAVQVVAYGTQKKVTVTGALATMKTEDILRAPVPNIAHALAGNLPGLSAIQYSGQPGADDPTIFIRGIGSLDADRAKPLMLVDGVERSFFRLDPNEIEDITILKDASATAVFGVRGANGVILVTTKRGQEGDARISISTSASIQRPIRVLKYVNSYDYATVYNEAQIYDGLDPADVRFQPHVMEAFRTHSDPLVYPDTDWMDMILKSSALQTQHNVNISGGTKRVRYFTSIGVLTQEGIFNSFDLDYNANFRYNRYNYRANLDIDVTNTTLLQLNLGGRLEDRNEPNTQDQWLYRDLTWSLPFAGAGIVDGKWIRASNDNIPGNVLGDPLSAYYGRGYRQKIDNVINLDIALTQKLDFVTKGLSLNLKGSYNSSYDHNKTRSKSTPYYTVHYEDPLNPQPAERFMRKVGEESTFGYGESFGRSRDWNLEASLRYARDFGKHHVSALALYNQWREQYPDGNKFDFIEIPRGYVGFVGRVTYDYNNRYMIDFNMGYNGSENFAPGRRYGFFPAVSGGWIISEESFMKGQDFLSYLKLRASYGLVGNDLVQGKSRFFYLPDSYNPSTGGYNFGTNVSSNQPGATEKILGNPWVTWEKAGKQNYGFDFSVLDDKLTGSFDYFIEKRNDILTTRNTAPGFLAVQMPVLNIGIVHNRGYEATLRWNHQVGEVKYWINANMSYAKNKIIYKDEVPRAYDWLYETGHSVGQQFGYVFDGFVTSDDLKPDSGMPEHAGELTEGDVKYKDLNGDGVIDDNDIMYIGNPKYPRLNGGVTIGASWKGFDFSMMWVGAAQASRFVGETLRRPFGYTNDRSLLQYMFEDRWTPETAETATFPKIAFKNVTNNYQNSTLWLKDASYLRLKNAQIGYTFSGDWMKSVKIQSLRFYVSGENLVTIDHLKISDPEATDDAQFNYPLLMVINFGLNINF